MICVRLSGGLGNQMFQYACGRALAYRHKVKLLLDLSFLEKSELQSNYTLRKYELGIFAVNAELRSKKELKKLNPSFYSRLYNRLCQHIELPMLFTPGVLIETKSHNYDKRVEKLSKNSVLIGCWQNELYFKQIEEIISEDFKFKLHIDNKNAERVQRIMKSNSISIHIRRGDYVENPETNKKHGLCSLAYYKSAIRFISQKVNSPVFFIFSDDLNWAKENLKLTFSHEFVSGNIGDKSYMDMQLMSLCKHNIIANSTFSWWGAWLNSNPQKIVIAPNQWFANKTRSYQINDLIPEDWKRL